MTKKKIQFNEDECEPLIFEDLTGPEALKVFKRLNNKYTSKVRVVSFIGHTCFSTKLKTREAMGLFTYQHDSRRYRNCHESTRWCIELDSMFLRISGKIFQDFEKTKANNWGEEVEGVIE